MKLFTTLLVCFAIIFFGVGCTKENSLEDTYVPKKAVKQNRSSKRGVSFDYQYIDDVNILAKGISWSYNWGVSYNASYNAVIDENQIDYCPMAWNGIDKEALRAYVITHPNCKYLLAFNEPNLTDQANMTPQEAAAKWADVKSIADELGLKIISPAMNYGTLENYSDPIKWLDEFFSLVPIADIEGISIHCYMPNAGALKSYVALFKKYKKPIWLTEFCAWDGLNENSFTAEGQQKHLSDVFNYLESDPDVFRYAWFIPRAGNVDAFPYMSLLTRSSTVALTELGNIFVQMSSQDKSTFYVEQQTVEAEHYSSISIAEGSSGPRVKTTTDPLESSKRSLELYNFFANQWVEYQFEIDQTKDFMLELRYACFVDTELDIEVDGALVTKSVLQNTGYNYVWNNAEIPLALSSGKHTIRILLTKGTFNLNRLKIS